MKSTKYDKISVKVTTTFNSITYRSERDSAPQMVVAVSAKRTKQNRTDSVIHPLTKTSSYTTLLSFQCKPGK